MELVIFLLLLLAVGWGIHLLNSLDAGGRSAQPNSYTYTTAQGHAYLFDMVTAGNEVRIYIVNAPDYGSRAADGHSTHRHYDERRQRHYVCVDPSLVPTNVVDALGWAVYWADGNSKYITTGEEFA